MNRILPLFALVAMLFASPALAGEDSPLVGKWEAISYNGEELPEGTFVVENHDDGSGTMYEGDEEFPYTWEHDADAGTCTIVADGETMVYNVTFEDDTCTFVDVDNEDDVMVMRRVED